MKTAIPKPSKQSIIREARDYVMIAIGMIFVWYRLDRFSVA